MTLVDTSVWIDHLRGSDGELAALLRNGAVLVHPFVLGELALGALRQRAAILEDLSELPRSVVAEDKEVMRLIAREALYGIGIGYVDAHLLASTRLTVGASLWTRDRRLAAAAARLGVAVSLPN